MKEPKPYVGLASFEEEDAPFFFGRGTERDMITANVLASRLTVLYGVSGVGKTSVLQAGVLPFLHELAQQDLDEYGTPEFAVVLFRSWLDDPVVALAKEIHESIAKTLRIPSLEPVPPSRDLSLVIKAWTERVGVKLLVILDQFEDYFAHHSQETGEGTFAVEFPKIVNHRDLRAHFLISIRADYLSRLDYFKDIPNLLYNRLEINRLNRKSASEAIEGPVDQYNKLRTSDTDKFQIAPTLIQEVLNQVEADRDSAGEPGRSTIKPVNSNIGFEAPYLQLVMRALWEQKETQSTRILRPETLRQELKGVGDIVLAHLKSVMGRLSPEEQKITDEMFKHLVTPSGIRRPQLASDLAKLTKAEPAKVESILKKLSSDRILRPVEPPGNRPGEPCYEVSLDVVAQAILNRLKDREQEQELAEAERKQAEAEHRAAERLRFALVSGLMVLVLAVLTIITYKKWQEANAQRERAENSRIQAYREDLINTIVLSPNQSEDPNVVLADLETELRLAELDKDPHDQVTILNKMGGICGSLAGLYEEQNDHVHAKEFQKRAEEYYLKVEALLPLIPDDYSVATTINDLAVLYSNQKRLDEAEPRYKQALSLSVKALGEENRYLALYLSNIVRFYSAQDRCTDAEPYYTWALRIMKKDLDSGRLSSYVAPYVADSAEGLADCHINQKKYDEAEQLFKDALLLREKSQGTDHPDVAATLKSYADLLENYMGRQAEAKLTRERANQILHKRKQEGSNK